MVNAWRMTSDRVRLCFLASLSMSWVNLSGKRTFMISITGHCITSVVRLKSLILYPVQASKIKLNLSN